MPRAFGRFGYALTITPVSRAGLPLGAALATWLFCCALAVAFAVAFVVTVPVNRWLIARGKGHVVVHEFHH